MTICIAGAKLGTEKSVMVFVCSAPVGGNPRAVLTASSTKSGARSVRPSRVCSGYSNEAKTTFRLVTLSHRAQWTVISSGSQWFPVSPSGFQCRPVVPSVAQWFPVVFSVAQWVPVVPIVA